MMFPGCTGTRCGTKIACGNRGAGWPPGGSSIDTVIHLAKVAVFELSWRRIYAEYQVSRKTHAQQCAQGIT